MRLRRFGGRRQLAPGRRGHPDRLARLDNFNLLALISCDAGQLAEIVGLSWVDQSIASV